MLGLSKFFLNTARYEFRWNTLIRRQIGSLSNDNGDAKDNWWRKMDLYFTFVFRNYQELFIKPSGLKPYLTKDVTQVINSSGTNEKLAVVAQVLHKTQDVVVLKSTVTKCTKIYNARAQPLFCSLNILFGDFLVPIP